MKPANKFKPIEPGTRFGKPVVERQGSSDQGVARWWCRCDCGNKTIVRGIHLRRGHVMSCGCVHHAKKQDYKARQRRLDTIRSWVRR